MTAKFTEIKPVKQKLKDDQIAKKLRCSYSILKRYRNDINILSPSKIPPNSHTTSQKTSNDNTPCERDVKRPQMTPKDPR